MMWIHPTPVKQEQRKGRDEGSVCDFRILKTHLSQVVWILIGGAKSKGCGTETELRTPVLIYGDCLSHGSSL